MTATAKLLLSGEPRARAAYTTPRAGCVLVSVHTNTDLKVKRGQKRLNIGSQRCCGFGMFFTCTGSPRLTPNYGAAFAAMPTQRLPRLTATCPGCSSTFCWSRGRAQGPVPPSHRWARRCCGTRQQQSLPGAALLLVSPSEARQYGTCCQAAGCFGRVGALPVGLCRWL